MILAIAVLAAERAYAQGVDVTVKTIQPTQHSMPRHKGMAASEVVVWLTPLHPEGQLPVDTAHRGPFRLVQKDKQFSPHLLVVPTGTSVEFPNKDPFFHNVFSLFNGKRFDLGLYESGTTRSVRFDREGVSYIFCNIHPEMGAVVVSLSTPYYAIASPDGTVVLHHVPPGNYRMNLWSETARPAKPEDGNRILQVGGAALRLDDINLTSIMNPMAEHKNKFGEEYRPGHESSY